MAPSNGRPLVLVANDQEWAVRSLETILVGRGYEVVRAYTGHQALERLVSHRPNAALLDAQMPDFDGMTVCRRIRSDPRFGARLPVLITTAGPAGRRERMAAYEAGAWDFTGFPLDAEMLLLKLGLFLEVGRASSAGPEELLDGETGLYSRDGLRRRAREIALHAARRREPVACVVVQVEPVAHGGIGADRNDDGLPGLLRRCGRGSDAIGRLDPDRFAVVGFGASDALARSLGQRLRAGVERVGAGVPEPARGAGIRIDVADLDTIAGPGADLGVASAGRP
jgi:CheY-like chemotaxis protein